MNEKELTENAAKAFGLRGFISEHRDCREFVVAGPTPVIFSPLKDDGDALRLAVKCGINPIQCIDSVDAMHFDSCIVETEMFEDHDGDVMAATRLAITRAAAAMVKER